MKDWKEGRSDGREGRRDGMRNWKEGEKDGREGRREGRRKVGGNEGRKEVI